MSLHEVAGSPPGFQGEPIQATLLDCLSDILRHDRLVPVFQPIVDLQRGTLVGYEGLIRGPSGSPLRSPLDLFRVAGENGLTIELELRCCQTLLRRFAGLGLPGQLFLNIGAPALPRLARDGKAMALNLESLGLAPARIVLELTEHSVHDREHFPGLLASYRGAGFQLAIDDLGEGYSSLRRWSEFKPEYVKVDMYFVRDVHLDSLKQQFLRSIRDIALESGAVVVAEGIEQVEELQFLRGIGIPGGQGFYIGMPESRPFASVPGPLLCELSRHMDEHKPTPASAAGKARAGGYRPEVSDCPPMQVQPSLAPRDTAA
ncbi:EAL domain-containing protein [Pusillimonas noertemannii]|uniref:EAL domain-containing protein (Putative c-di-GMP-specific phosphodiesterase class I) n=1 Tax=Pusillimonas noertemannii TaxID=305977 RepID=A0A2U1CHQ9_9BURK|nr:EAL domain-containing protein [Pusillimonas noertemannii]NYT70303.1 EAL domain-containing protein [Pusillimonas noertemannii]PVY60445.1 EAL domain-containing protein (putative c-di-GMP-specific phosphodiesterase class I) [Pusillimonas noertemannii]TFL08059.1 EAL domain-containing protein [Pusillimonas noertemannii]